MKTPVFAQLGAVLVGCVLATLPAGAQAPAPVPPPAIPYGPPIMLEQARQVMAAAEAEARKHGWNIVISVVDSGGHLVAMQRLDGTSLGSIEAARQKAYSAVIFRRSTKFFADGISQGGIFLAILKLDGASPLEGGLPIVVDGKIVGAIGVSGVAPAQDGQIARAGAEAMK